MPYATNSDDGASIHYEVGGSGSPLVILPGNTGSAALWRTMGYQPAFESTHRVIAIDPLGHGESDMPRDASSYSTERDAADVAAVLDALSINRASLMGYSMGAQIAVGFGAIFPDRTRAIVAGGTSHFVSRAPSPSAGLPDTETLVAIMRGAHEAHDTPFTEDYRAGFSLNDVAALQARSDAGLEEHFSPAWETMPWPALFYVGSEDSLLPLSQQLVEQIPDAELYVVEGADHMDVAVPKTHAETFPVVRAFLERVEASS